MEDGLRQHQSYARTGNAPQDERFGVESPFKPTGGEKPPRGHLKETNRGISRPRGYHPQPDHGDY